MILSTLTNFIDEYKLVLIKCKSMEGNKFKTLIYFYYYKFKGKHILIHHNSIIKGLNNIVTKDILSIGIDYYGFISKKDSTYLNIQGKLNIEGVFSIGRGCRIFIGPKATCTLNKNSYISPFTNIIVMHGISIGEGCAISWNCQFLDEDFHTIEYKDKRLAKKNFIEIGDNVWIGCNVNIFKGTQIANGSVIAANSVVRGNFQEKNCLIGGNPAVIIKRNITWN